MVSLDIVDIILKSELLQKGVTMLREFIRGFLPSDFLYFLLWVGISIAVAMYISGKTLTKTAHIITLAILIFLGLKYMNIV